MPLRSLIGKMLKKKKKSLSSRVDRDQVKKLKDAQNKKDRQLRQLSSKADKMKQKPRRGETPNSEAMRKARKRAAFKKVGL